MASEAGSSKITLVSSDDRKFEVDFNAIRHSGTIRTMIHDLGMESDGGRIEGKNPIPITAVRAEILEKVLEFCEHYKDVEPKNENQMGKGEIPAWDAEFLKVEKYDLFDLIAAANYLDIKALLDSGCQTVANMIKGKSVKEIREILEVENDFTPEEEEQVRAENEWCP